MNAGVILAAGDSTRMGFPKQLAEVKDKPLLELVIEKVNSYFESSTVVLGFENEIIEEKINFYNSKKWRLSGTPSMGGHGSALSVAKLYDLLANDLKLDHKKIISQKKFKKILLQSPARLDEGLKLPIKWTYSGYILRGGWMFGKNKESFGHNGWGGSLGFGDPIEGMGISYVTRKINSNMGADSRAVNLIKKTYEILNN